MNPLRPTRFTLLLVALAAASTALAEASEPAAPHGATPIIRPALATRASASAAESADPLDRVRERLAEKLGAAKAPDTGNPNILRVTSKATTEAAPAAAHRAAPPKAPAKAAEPPHDLHWDYKGEGGPQAWGGLKPEFNLCSSGKRQSPIDIRDGIAVDLEPVQFDYRASGFSVIDNGHTVQVNVAPGNFIQANGRRWELVQFHFHRPSEERIDGRQFDMVVHLVHKDSDGRLAVVAVLLDRGSIQPIVQTIWNNLPLEKGEEVPARAVIDLNHLLPPDRRYYTYMGSLTTPPCSEGVLWMVMRQPVPVSQEQIDIFARLYPMNARPLQQASGRLIKQSN
jgi:carbonic anhydrase